MHKITASLFALLVGIAALGLTTSPARAALLLVDGSGQLIGAQNVDVLGTLYNVTFVDGSCISLFSGCDELSDFDFNLEVAAVSAAEALLQQVFVDGAAGLFATDPAMTFGCDRFAVPAPPYRCSTYVPYGFNSTGTDTLGGRVVNFDGPGDFADASSVNPTVDFSMVQVNDGGELNFARFTRITAIPEPSTLLLFGVGLAGIAGFGWRRQG